MAGRQIICNGCGRPLSEKNGIWQEDALIIKKEWGYFSHKDLEVHAIVLCEECYDKWVETLAIPPVKSNKAEVMTGS